MNTKIALRLLALPLLFALPATSEPAAAAPAQYVLVCTQYGAGWFYIPGTDTCINPKTGVMKHQVASGTGAVTVTENSDVLQQALQAKEGVALSLALPTPTVTAGHHFAAAFNVGTFGGQSAVGVGGAWQPNDNVTFNAGIGVGDLGDVGGRGGVNVSW